MDIKLPAIKNSTGTYRDDTFSNPSTLKCGVPQGSVLGPILFTLFTAPFGELCRQYHTNFHSYADDQQNYLSFKPNSTGSLESCIRSLETCIGEIHKWMRTNKLKLNDGKTEVVLFGTRQQPEKLENNENVNIKISDEVIRPAPSARNLGYIMESELRSKAHIGKICGSSSYTLKNISRIQKIITPEGAKILVQGLVISNLDYCNTLLLGVSDQQLSKLQKIQNMGCHVINKLGKYDHVTDSMTDLHWLKVTACIQYKALVTVYQCVNDLTPSFVKDLLNVDLHRKSLKSETH